MEKHTIKSPLSKTDLKEIAFESKLKKLFEDEKVEGVLVFYIPKVGDVHMFDYNLCGHQLKTLAETIDDMAEEVLKEEE